MHLNAPPGAFQSTPRAQSASQPCLAPMDTPSSPRSGPQANARSCAYLEIHDDYNDDNDELPPIPEEWATPFIATHCQPDQPQSAAVCAPASVRCTEDNTRDYKWLTDIFANRRYDVRWNFNLCPDREADFRRRRDVALALMATRALHFEKFRLEVIDEGFTATFGCGGPLYDYVDQTLPGLEPVDEAEAERQWYLEELAFADEEAEEDDGSYYRSDMSDQASSYEESLHTPTDESPMQDQDAPFSAESLKVELKQAIKAFDRELHHVYVKSHVQTMHVASSCQSIASHRHDNGTNYGAKASLAATLSHLHPKPHHCPSSSEATSTSGIDVEAVAMSILTWPATLMTYAVSSLVPLN